MPLPHSRRVCQRPWRAGRIDPHTIPGGAGKSAGGSYALNGSAGQLSAHPQPLTGGRFTVTGGFWSLFLVQTEGAPLLKIQVLTGTTARIEWPAPATGYLLQVNTAVASPHWIPAPEPVQQNGGMNFININAPPGNRYYRLFKP